MRGFMLFCLVTSAFSAPQNFQYEATLQPRQPHLEYGPAPTPSPAIALDFFQNLQALMALQTSNVGETYSSNSIEQFAATPQQQSYQSTNPQMQYLAPNFADLSTNSLRTPYESAQMNFMRQQQQPIISKRFFLHSAPEEEEDEEVQHKHITIGKPRKNLNVVFIRAPAKSAQRTTFKISPAVNEEKTFIYVLAKKQDAADIDAHVYEPITTTAKPEVFFIKYKTPEEAEHAQRTIQSQYDSLGGSTQISNEGIAPVASVIGALDAAKYAAVNEAQYAAADAAQQQQQAEEEFVNTQLFESQQTQPEEEIRTNNGYLPPSLRKY